MCLFRDENDPARPLAHLDRIRNHPRRDRDRIPAFDSQARSQIQAQDSRSHSADSFPMKTDTQIPANLPPLPEPPDGHKWEYRGPQWTPGKTEHYASINGGQWYVFLEQSPTGNSDHYAEAVPIETEPNYADRDYQKSVLDAAWEGKECEYLPFGGEVWAKESGSTPEAVCSSVANSIRDGLKIRIKPTEPAPDPYASLKAAHAAGKAIQYNVGSHSRPFWSNLPNPAWDADPSGYRIKPDPITVPLEASDLPSPVAWILWPDGAAFMVTEVNSKGVSIAHRGFHSFLRLFEEGMKVSPDRKTWKPCSKTVEQ